MIKTYEEYNSNYDSGIRQMTNTDIEYFLGERKYESFTDSEIGELESIGLDIGHVFSGYILFNYKDKESRYKRYGFELGKYDDEWFVISDTRNLAYINDKSIKIDELDITINFSKSERGITILCDQFDSVIKFLKIYKKYL